MGHLFWGWRPGAGELEREVRMCASQPEYWGPGFLHLHSLPLSSTFFFFFFKEPYLNSRTSLPPWSAESK